MHLRKGPSSISPYSMHLLGKGSGILILSWGMPFHIDQSGSNTPSASEILAILASNEQLLSGMAHRSEAIAVTMLSFL